MIKGSIGYTHNLGNYENVKLEVGIEDYVRQNENVEQAFERMFTELGNQLSNRVLKAVEELEK